MNLIYLLIEFIDELIFGAGETAWPSSATTCISTIRRSVWRWLLLLEFADLMLDVLFSFLALYFVDVVNTTESQAGIAVTVWLLMGLITDLLFIPFADKQTRFNSCAALRSSTPSLL